jgi:hypothetical protein
MPAFQTGDWPMRTRLIALLLLIGLAAPAYSQNEDPLPPKRLTVTRNMDFPGGDFQSIFDTTYQACANACLGTSQCRALTFNTRSNACFLKSGTPGEAAYDGATSARVFDTDVALLAAGPQRLAELSFLGASDRIQARAFGLGISEEFSAGSWNLDQLKKAAGDARSTGNIADAVLYTGAALTLSDGADLWTEYARLMLVRSKERIAVLNPERSQVGFERSRQSSGPLAESPKLVKILLGDRHLAHRHFPIPRIAALTACNTSFRCFFRRAKFKA